MSKNQSSSMKVEIVIMVNLPEAPLNTLKFDRIDPSVFKRIARTGMREDMTTRAAYSSDASIFRRIPKA
ncbi:hypothetical protein, partial [Corynebacterium casei]|uniref:hypothetical protein n=2 Tax=Corynebacterium casei TaxID=160386 RepID=UPI00264744FD